MPFPLTDQAPLHRVGGHIALDFANTVSWRGTSREIDHLENAGTILNWAIAVGLIDETASLEDPEGFARRALGLRSAVRGAFEACVSGTPAPGDRAMLLEIAGECLRSAELADLPARLKYRSVEGGILGTIAWASVDLLCSDRIRRIKICPPSDCRWLFLDTTKNGSRRWCDMGACGTRSKVARHRVRQRATQ